MEASTKKNFKYDKIVSQLKDFPNLSEKKRAKVLKKILTDESSLVWQFETIPNSNQPDNRSEKLYELMAAPSVMRSYETLLDYYDKKTFDRSSVIILNVVLDVAIQNNNKMVMDIKATDGPITSHEVKDKTMKAEKYAERLDELKSLIRKLSKNALNDIADASHLSQDMIFRAITAIPDKRFIPKYKISHFTMSVLEELYAEASRQKRWPSNIKWKPLFNVLFGAEQIPSVAVAILLEGKHRLAPYKDSDNVNTVADCWDSLTTYALGVLDSVPNDVRKQMVELYLKKINKMILQRQGRPVDIRVNLNRLPNEFSNLVRTVNLYREALTNVMRKITGDTNPQRHDRRDDRPRNNQNDYNRRSDSRDEEEPKKDLFDKITDSIAKVTDVVSSVIDDSDDDDDND